MEETNKKLLINCRNGVLDVRERRLLPHAGDELGDLPQINANFDLGASAERWKQFLAEIFPEDATKKYGELGKADVLQQFFGYCLLPDCRYQKAMFMRGFGANGKSVVLNALISVIGKENTSALSIDDLNQRFMPQFLDGKMINATSRDIMRSGTAFEKFEYAVRGDALTAERKYGGVWVFNPTAKWLIAMNEIPDLPYISYTFIARNVIVLEFRRRFHQSEIDPRLSDKLDEERDGILTWAVHGLEKLLRHKGFEIPEMVKEEIAGFMLYANSVLLFVDEELVIDKDQEIGAVELFDAYKKWCIDGNMRGLGRQRFENEIMINFPTVVKARIGSLGSRKAGFRGIGLKSKVD
jgi:P4 family phage/plasmid primase-like protien